MVSGGYVCACVQAQPRFSRRHHGFTKRASESTGESEIVSARHNQKMHCNVILVAKKVEMTNWPGENGKLIEREKTKIRISKFTHV